MAKSDEPTHQESNHASSLRAIITTQAAIETSQLHLSQLMKSLEKANRSIASSMKLLRGATGGNDGSDGDTRAGRTASVIASPS
jgi:hypothetical protein